MAQLVQTHHKAAGVTNGTHSMARMRQRKVESERSRTKLGVQQGKQRKGAFVLLTCKGIKLDFQSAIFFTHIC